MHSALGDSKSQRTSKLHDWFKSYSDFSEQRGFPYWWSCIGKGLRHPDWMTWTSPKKCRRWHRHTNRQKEGNPNLQIQPPRGPMSEKKQECMGFLPSRGTVPCEVMSPGSDFVVLKIYSFISHKLRHLLMPKKFFVGIWVSKVWIKFFWADFFPQVNFSFTVSQHNQKINLKAKKKNQLKKIPQTFCQLY